MSGRALPRRCKSGSPRWAPKPACITPGSPWESGYIESFNARLRDELRDGENFFSLEEARDRKKQSMLTVQPTSNPTQTMEPGPTVN